MKIEPKAGPHHIPVGRPAAPSQHAKDARSRAMSKLMGESSSQPSHTNQATQVEQHSEMAQVTNEQTPNKALEAALSLQSQGLSQATGQKYTSDTSESTEVVTPPVAQVNTQQELKEETKDPEQSTLSSHYAILARKEKALRAKAAQQEESLRQEREALKAQQEALKAKELEYQSKYISKDKFLEDPVSVMQDTGLTYEQLTERFLNPAQAQQYDYIKRLESKMEERFKSFQEQQEKAVKAQEEATQKQYKQALTQIHHDVKNLVSKDAAYEIIKATESTQDVVDLIERVWSKEKRLMSVEEACQEVETYLLEESSKIFNINKIKQKFQPAASAQAQVEKPAQPQQQPQTMKTLTNSVSTSRKLSARERALLAFQGKKNN